MYAQGALSANRDGRRSRARFQSVGSYAGRKNVSDLLRGSSTLSKLARNAKTSLAPRPLQAPGGLPS